MDFTNELELKQGQIESLTISNGELKAEIASLE